MGRRGERVVDDVWAAAVVDDGWVTEEVDNAQVPTDAWMNSQVPSGDYLIDDQQWRNDWQKIGAYYRDGWPMFGDALEYYGFDDERTGNPCANARGNQEWTQEGLAYCEDSPLASLRDYVPRLSGGGATRERGQRTSEARHRRWQHFRDRTKSKASDAPFGSWTKSRLSALHVNIQGFLSSSAELVARLRMMQEKPTIVCLNETFLDSSVQHITLEGYSLIARRDRNDGRRCGGVAVFALAGKANSITKLKESEDSERLWILVHSDLGPFLLAAWYRPPVQGEVNSIRSLREEWQHLGKEAMGTVILGDLNIHHKKWLRRSARNSAEGEELQRFCLDFGMRQLVHEPTREQYLLDLAITDVEDAKYKVLPKIADHSCILVYFDLPVPKTEVKERRVWRYQKADWNALKTNLASHDWSVLEVGSVDDAAEAFTRDILHIAEKHIPRNKMREQKSTHAWVNQRVVELVMAKNAAAETSEARAASEACSVGITEEFAKYVEKERTRLKMVPRGSKGWWAKSRQLLKQKSRTCSIPALKKANGQWCQDAKSKADHLAATFKSKFSLCERLENNYSEINVPFYRRQAAIEEVTEERAERVLKGLRSDSSTGPDGLPSRVLKECAKELATPFCKLARRILAEGRWPEPWMLHWIVPLYKRKSVYDAGNYRGVHLTAQISKAMERQLRMLFMPFVLRNDAFGPNQFAYVPERGARDALAYMVLEWITALAKGRKVAIYCSDVSGAFDRVRLERLAAKLRAKKIHPALVDVIISWLRKRRAVVVVGGETSEVFDLSNMVFQGTVWGPTLWNIFYEDARNAINEVFFKEVVFADDLNAYRVFPGTVSNKVILKSIKGCQAELHGWGAANQVTFDPGKESSHILSGSQAHGADFKLLGVVFDVAMKMNGAVEEVVKEAGWKLKMLLRTKRYYTDGDLVILFKAHLLGYLEYRTPAVYHATRDILTKLDRVLTKFLEDLGLSEVEALMNFNMAPLAARRDIAMLGLIHRTVLGKGPRHFKDHFKVASSGILLDPRESITGGGALMKRSALGLVAIYNLLPTASKSKRTVREFQTSLQQLLKDRANEGRDDWAKTLCPRMPLQRHPLKV
jgi:hypothetical protein